MKIIKSTQLVFLCMEKLILTLYSNGGVCILLLWCCSNNSQTFLKPKLTFILSVYSRGTTGFPSERQQDCFQEANWRQGRESVARGARVPVADVLISQRLLLMVLSGERQLEQESR